ncbi:MAG: tRNA (N(6)-L-threonylcarbamoyladenosine(37)-C(2))-methylthiotransferase MtaB [Bacilli bacterium]
MTFYIYNLGCKVNAYESSVMHDLMVNASFIKTSMMADIYIINTCSVTNTADNKSLKLIRQAYRKNNKAIIAVTGCLAQTQVDRVKAIPGVSIIIGNKNKSKIVDYIYEYKKHGKQIIDIYDLSNVAFENMQLNNFCQARAFVKIEDGCENFCSYCIIPYTRGCVRSKAKDVVLKEVCSLIKSGHQEIVLTGIHTGNYGVDLHYDLASLLALLIKIAGLKRLRISSIEITELNERILDLFKISTVLVDHLHIPLQSGSDYILTLMQRKYDSKYFMAKLSAIRTIRPNIAITTDVIVGFPGESEEIFNDTLATIRKCKFAKIHVFPYSKRNGTPASLMDNQIDEGVKKARVTKLLELSRQLEIDYMKQFIGTQLDVIIEYRKDGFLFGHTGNYLFVKLLDNNEQLNCCIKGVVIDICYPYCIVKVDV